MCVIIVNSKYKNMPKEFEEGSNFASRVDSFDILS